MHRFLAAGAVIVFGAVITPMTAGATPATSTTAPTVASALAHDAARSLAVPVPGARPRATAALAVTISSSCAGFCFLPARLTVAVGDTVTWVNRTGTAHNVTRCNPGGCDGVAGGNGTDGSFTAGNIGAAAGASFSHRFTAPGTYVYYCTIHGYAAMHGTIAVTAAAPTTTVTAPPTVPSPVTPAPPPPTPTTPPAPQLANTGATPGGAVALAILLIVSGLAATLRPRRLRRSARAR